MHLFAFLGTGNYIPCAYRADWQEDFGDPVVFVQTASVEALNDLLGEGEEVARVTIFCTSESRAKHSEALAAEFSERGLPAPALVDVPSNFARDGMLALFDRLVDTLAEDDAVLAFDMTHGFRIQPGVALLVLDYLQAVHPGIEVRHLLYGAWTPGAAQAPLVDLIELWELRDWAYGFRNFHRFGDASQLHKLTSAAQGAYFRNNRGSRGGARPQLGYLAGALRAFDNYASLNAIPNLFGEEAGKGAFAYLKEHIEKEWNPLSAEVGRFVAPLRAQLGEQLDALVADQWDSPEGLAAQLTWIAWLRDHQRYQEALTVAREWSVTFLHMILARGGLEVTRADGEDVFGQYVGLKPEQRDGVVQQLDAHLGMEFSAVCSQLGRMRNRINHAFMPSGRDNDKPADKINPVKVLDTALEVFTAALEKLDFSPSPSAPGKALFAAVGLSPGALYTAVLCQEPDVVAILTTERAREGVDQALAALAEQGLAPEVHMDIIEEPFTGFREAQQAATRLAAHARTLNVINVAGGTAAMQYGIGSLARTLAGIGRSVRQGATIDRRSSQAQREEPFVLGEWAWVDEG